MEKENDLFITNFCDICRFIFQNAANINQADERGSEREKTKMDVVKEPKVKVDPKTMQNNKSKDCKFCFGIFNHEKFQSIVDEMHRQLKRYDFIDFKISTTFSPLFSFFHNYVN